MRKAIVLVVILLGLCTAVWGQEGPLPTELPIVVVKGKDRSYIQVIRAKMLARMSHRGEKIIFSPPHQLWGEKSYPRPPSMPALEIEPPVVIPQVESKELSPPNLSQVSLSMPLVVQYAPPGYPTKTPSIMVSERGEILSLPKESQLFERAFPTSRKESPFPYLHFTASAGSHNNYGYNLDYGRKWEKTAWIFNLGRSFSPHRIEYGKEELGRDEDRVTVEFIRDSGEDTKISLGLGGHQRKLDLLDGTERTKNKLDASGEWKIKGERNNFRIQGWVERTRIGSQDKIEYEDVVMGTKISLQMLRSPLIGGLEGETSTSSGSTQAYLYLAGNNVILKDIIGLVLNIEVGLKDIGGWGTEFLPQFELTSQINPRLKIQLNAQKEFRLARFSDLYFSQDYVIINEDLPPFSPWGFGGGFTYSPTKTWDVSLEGFLNRGDNLIWNWDSTSSLMRPLIRDILLKGGRLSWVFHLGGIFEQELAYVYQEVNNQDDPEKLVPGYPESSGELWLRWKPGIWLIEAGGKIEGERYYEENSGDVLPRGYKGKIKLARKIGKGGECWIELELNDYSPGKNLSLPDQKVSMGIHIPLF